MKEKSKKFFMLIFFGLGNKSQVLRFLVGGGSAFAADLSTLYFFRGILEWPLLVSVALAFMVGFTTTFIVQKYWTFTDKTYDNIHKQAGATFGLTVVNFFANLLLMYFLVNILGVWYILAKIFVAGGLAIINFFIYKHVIFNTKEKSDSEPMESK